MVDGIGGTIGNYRIEAPLGTGGMGRVYRAVHIHINRTVALKVLHDQHSANTMFQARFLREAQAAAALKHPNVVDVIDFNDHNGAYYLVMEYVPDGSLRGLLKDQASKGRALPLGLGLDLIRQAADGLHYAHQHGMIHRDIKPDNLLLQRDAGTGRYTLKIADFGLAHLDTGNTLTLEGQTMGTPAYMSPEQCQGVELDSRSDIYSLGVVLYEVITGTVPFDSRSLSEAVYKHVYVEPPSPLSVRPDLPPELAEVVLRCLKKDPNERYATAGELAAALRALGPAAAASADVPAASPAPQSPPPSTDRLSVEVDQPRMLVTPGEPSDLTITLANLGAEPLRATVTIDGVPRQWISTPPNNVELAPGARVSGPVRVRVPVEAATQQADYDLTVRASAPGDPDLEATAQAHVTVQPSQPVVAAAPTVGPAPSPSQAPSFAPGSVALVPGVAGARRAAAYDLTLHNTDSVPHTIAPSARSDDPTLQITVDPPMATVDPGQTTTVRVNVAAPPRWFGTGQPKPFMVGGGGDGLPPVRGQFVQQPFFPMWIVVVLALALLGGGAVAASTLLGDDDDPGQGGVATATETAADPTATTGAADPTEPPAGDTATPDAAGEPTSTEPVASTDPTPTEAAATDATPTSAPEAPTDTPAAVEPTPTDTAEPEPEPTPELIAFSAGRNFADPAGILDIYVMEPDGSNQRPLISEPDDDWLPAFSPDGQWIAWVSRQHGNHQIYLARSDGSDIRRLMTSEANDLHPNWSPDSRYILFQRDLDGLTDLLLYDTAEDAVIPLTDDSFFDGYAQWSPDGQQIVWTSNRDGQNEIYTMRVHEEPRTPVRITNNPATDYFPVWAPDGERIAWLSDRAGGFDVHMMFADGSNPTRWTSAAEDDTHPAWSPDGSAIAYVRRIGGVGHLYVLEGGIERPIATNADADDPGIRWSPDGTRIAYTSRVTGLYDIWIVALDGSAPLQLTGPDEGNDQNISWFPSGG